MRVREAKWLFVLGKFPSGFISWPEGFFLLRDMERCLFMTGGEGVYNEGMTKEQFIEAYIANSKDLTREWLDKHMVALPCRCDGENCKGWAMVSNDPDVIRHHKALYEGSDAD
jgi:hypothetical protein